MNRSKVLPRFATLKIRLVLRLSIHAPLLVLLLPLIAGPLPAAISFSPALVISEPLHDFGIVTGRYASHVFTLCNASTNELTITRVRACCGAKCELTVTNLPPGAISELRVSLDLAGRSGAWRKTLYIHANDPNRAISSVRLTGTLAETPIVLRPTTTSELPPGTSR